MSGFTLNADTAAIYARISRDREGTEVGVENQITACRELAATAGKDVVRTYIDNDRGASTRSRKPRPDYVEMLAAAKRGEFNTIIAYSNSRLTRRPREFEDLIALAESHGIRFMTKVSGNDDLSTADGRMVARIKAASDAAEAERTGERVSFAHEAKRQRGQDTGGPRPFGFEVDRVTIRETEAALIRQGVQMILDGSTMYAVAKAWDASGIREQKWRSQAVRDILIRPRNTGNLVVNGVDYGRGDRPAIITEDARRDLVAILSLNEKPRRGRKPQTSTAVTIVTCGACGAPVELTMKDHRRTIRCSVRGGGIRHPTIGAEDLEKQLAQSALMQVLGGAGAADDRPEVAALRKELARLSTLRDRAREDVEAYDDPEDRAHARRRVGELTGMVKEAQSALDAALVADVASRARHLVDEAVGELGEGVAYIDPHTVWPRWEELWQSWQVGDRRELLRGRKIELMPGRGGWRLNIDGRGSPAQLAPIEAY